MHKPVSLFFGLVILIAVSGQATPPGEARPSGPVVADRVRLAREAFSVMDQRAKQEVPVSSDLYLLWSFRLMQAERDASRDKVGRVAAVQAHLNRLRDEEAKAARLFRTRKTKTMDHLDVQWKLLEAEAMLAEEKAGR